MNLYLHVWIPFISLALFHNLSHFFTIPIFFHFPTLFATLSQSHAHSHTHTLTLPHFLPHSPPHSPPYSCPHSHSLSLSLPQTMGFPPAENREAALLAMSVQDPFSVSLRASQHQQLLEMEEAATEAMFVIMSDVQLDRPLVSVRASLQAFHRPFVPGSIYLYFRVV